MTCETLERLVQALSTSRCFVSNFETGHILTERCDQRCRGSSIRRAGLDPPRFRGKTRRLAPGGGALLSPCPPASACGRHLLLYLRQKGTPTRRSQLRGGPL